MSLSKTLIQLAGITFMVLFCDKAGNITDWQLPNPQCIDPVVVSLIASGNCSTIQDASRLAAHCQAVGKDKRKQEYHYMIWS